MGRVAAAETGSVIPKWMDILIAVWIIAAGVSFVMKILLDTGTVPAYMGFIVIMGKFAYAFMIGCCLVGGSLALVREIGRS